MLFHSWVQSTFCSHIIALGRWFTAVAFNNDQASYENPSVQFMGSNRTLSNTKDSRAASTNVFLILSGSFIQSEITDVCLYGKFPWNPFKKKQYEEILKINAVIFTWICLCLSLNRRNNLSTYAFFPQMEPRYQLRQVLKYFFLVPMTCWSAQTLGLMRREEALISRLNTRIVKIYGNSHKSQLWHQKHSAG